MQQEQMGRTLTATTIFSAPCETEVIVKRAGRPMRGDYPCGCSFCREAAVANQARRVSSLATIDVYDLPDGIETSAQNYFSLTA